MMLALEREPKQIRQWGRVVARAWDDTAFRQRLLTEPASVLGEAGIEVPPGVAVRVVESSLAEAAEDDPCFWLPPSPADADLIEDDLGLPPEAHNGIHCRHGRTKPLPSERVAELRLPAHPAAEDLIEDDLGLPPGVHNITHCSGHRTKPL
jgi:hypothetical protein